MRDPGWSVAPGLRLSSACKFLGGHIKLVATYPAAGG